MNSTLNKIKELQKVIESGKLWKVIIAESEMRTVLPSLIQEHEALLRFVEEIKTLDIQHEVIRESGDGSSIVKVNPLQHPISAALQALDKELKQ
jgi:hypothetical protein